jgi:hypothetical protein
VGRATAISLAVLVGCGRIGFDASTNSTPDGGSDPSGDGGAPPGAEVRDEQRISGNGDASEPALTWNGASFALVWKEYRSGTPNLHLTGIELDGSLATPVQLTSDNADHWGTAIAWSGTRYGVIWYRIATNSSIHVLTADDAGGVTGGPTQASPNPMNAKQPSIAWNGVDFGVAFNAADDGVRYARATSTASIGTSVQIGTSPSFFTPALLIWTGDRYGVVWASGNGCALNLVEIDVAGATLGSPVPLADAVGQGCAGDFAGTWLGDSYAIVWVTGSAGDMTLWFRRAGASGTALGPDTILDRAASLLDPQLVASGTELGVLWRHTPTELRFMRISPDGTAIGGAALVSATATASQAALASNGTTYAAAWVDRRHGDTDVYAALIDASP